MVVEVGLTTTEPDVALLVLKFVPLHEVALVLDQVSVTDAPEATELDDADKVAVGAGLLDTVTLAVSVSVPPAPVQLSV